MNKAIIYFEANEQCLNRTGTECFASDTVSYIEADFNLGENWNGFDSVRAVWSNGWETISTVLDSDGKTIVPTEVLTRRAKVRVNLVGSIASGNELTDRLTTFPIEALDITKKALIDGSETAPITPSQFEQFVANVKADADRSESAMRESESIKTEVEGLKSDVVQLKADTEQIKTDVETIADGFDAKVTEALEDISEAKTDALDGISSAKADALTDIGSAKTQAVDDITEEGTRQVGLVTEEGTDQIEAVQNEGETQVNAVRTEGGTQITNIEQKGADVLARIPYFAPIITDTAEGSIASFSDGADDYPMKSVVAEIVPKQEGSGDPSPTNVRPISGWSGVNVEQRGKNLLDPSAKTNPINTNVYFWYNGGYKLPAGTYTISFKGNITLSGLYAIDREKNVNMAFIYNRNTLTFTIAEEKMVTVNFYYASGFPDTSDNLFQLEEGTTATAYEPYQGSPYSIPFKDSEDNPITVYGGEIDVVSGEGESKMVLIDLGSLNWVYVTNYAVKYFEATMPNDSVPNTVKGGEGVCSNYAKYDQSVGGNFWQRMPNEHFIYSASGVTSQKRVYIRDDAYTDPAEFKTAMNGVQFCYELATPTDFTTTPTEINSYKGNNTLWSDGAVECEYCADTKLYIDKKINALI